MKKCHHFFRLSEKVIALMFDWSCDLSQEYNIICLLIVFIHRKQCFCISFSEDLSHILSKYDSGEVYLSMGLDCLFLLYFIILQI